MEALNQFIRNIIEFIIQPAIWLLFSLALYYFVAGMIPFLMKADDPKERDKGRQHILWGLIGFVIMVSVIGILQVVTGTFEVSLPETPR